MGPLTHKNVVHKVDSRMTIGQLKALLLAWIGNGQSDKVWLASKGKLLMDEEMTAIEAGITDFSKVEIVTR